VTVLSDMCSQSATICMQ